MSNEPSRMENLFAGSSPVHPANLKPAQPWCCAGFLLLGDDPVDDDLAHLGSKAREVRAETCHPHHEIRMSARILVGLEDRFPVEDVHVDLRAAHQEVAADKSHDLVNALARF